MTDEPDARELPTSTGCVEATGGLRAPSVIARVARHPAPVFLVVGLLAGAALAAALPPLAGYDETTHLERAWQVSDGQVFASARGRPDARAVGGELPAGMLRGAARLLRAWFPDAATIAGGGGRGYSASWQLLDEPAPRGPAVFTQFPQASVYSPVVYAPAAIGLRLGRLAGASLYVDIVLARAATFGAYIALTWLAIRRTPIAPWLFATAGLAPVALVQASTLGADAVTIGLSFVVLAEALRLLDPALATRRALGAAAAAAGALALAKAPYVVVTAALVLAARRNTGRTRVALVAVVGGSLVLAASWAGYARAIYVEQTNPFTWGPTTAVTWAYHDVDPSAQLRRVVTRPLTLPRAVAGTIAHDGARVARDAVAQSPWWLPPPWVAVAVALALALVAAAARRPARDLPDLPDPRDPRGARATLAAIAAAGTVGVFLLAYTGWNAVGAPRVDAFQGRYLFPLLVTALLAVAARSGGRALDGRAAYLVFAALGLEVAALVALVTGLVGFFT